MHRVKPANIIFIQYVHGGGCFSMTEMCARARMRVCVCVRVHVGRCVCSLCTKYVYAYVCMTVNERQRET